MEISIAHETQLFLSSLVVGAVLSAVYDIFRIFRVAVKNSRAAVMAEDIFYFTLCAFVTFTFILKDNSGTVRIYILFGEALGWVLYYLSLGALVFSFSKRLIGFVKAVAEFFARWFIRPLWRLFSSFYRFMAEPFLLICRHAKKVLINRKYSLKRTGLMLYNLLNDKNDPSA